MIPEGTIMTVAILPDPWPPRRTVELFANGQAGGRIALSAESGGYFAIAISQVGQKPQTHRFGPLDAQGGSKVILSLMWSPQGVHFHVNGIAIPNEADGPHPVQLLAQEVLPIGPVLRNLDPTAGRSDDERFFLATLCDIDRKVLAGDRYSLIRASGLLRQLLLEGLVHLINRTHRTRMEFSTIDFTGPVPLEPDAHWLSLDPSQFPNARRVVCTLDQFLAAPCLRWNGASASVKDLIRVCANAKGGVHLGKARATEEQILLDWDRVFSVLGKEPSVRALAGVCRVALAGLTSLAIAVSDTANQPGG